LETKGILKRKYVCTTFSAIIYLYNGFKIFCVKKCCKARVYTTHTEIEIVSSVIQFPEKRRRKGTFKKRQRILNDIK